MPNRQSIDGLDAIADGMKKRIAMFSPWSAPYVEQLLFEYKLAVDDTTLASPKGAVIRAQTAVMLRLLLEGSKLYKKLTM